MRRFGLLYLALNVVALGLWVVWHFGAQTLAGAGLAGERGMLEVTSCQDRSYTTDRGGSGTVHHCYGDFQPDGGGPAVSGIELRGGSGDAYLTSNSCKGSTTKPWWCRTNPDSVRARYVHGQAWIYGNGMVLPTGAAVMGTAIVGAGLLIGYRGLGRPVPRRLQKAPAVLVMTLAAGFCVVLLAMVME
ncbi:hypothetical protein [Kitasatospora sp. NPDC057223]|uniref:hypothetical protein n=1 Tax=Kitasatospora sp. NPDC057223 TaxID=3346055 RepID=UPI0036274B58